MKVAGVLSFMVVLLSQGALANAADGCLDRFGGKVAVGSVATIAHRSEKGVFFTRTCQSDGSFALVQANTKGSLKFSQDWDMKAHCTWEAEKLEVQGAPVPHELNGVKYVVGCVPVPTGAGYNLFAVYAD